MDRKPYRIDQKIEVNGEIITVPNVLVEFFWSDDTETWEECISGPEMRRIEKAIEERYPGYFRQ